MSITHVVAAGDLCLPSIGSLADDLSQAFAAGDAVRLDLSAVAAPDLSVLQLVESARRAACDEGRDFALTAPVGAPFRALLARAGFIPASDEDATFWFHGDSAQ
ncbi:anti-anti-sigma regulatory factor [Sphingomonas endophytica]|uniref:Anti-anti-sigma regulatory factor n=1 Tax=Sphingomonas endophytica TaxID=869719 RepID=A0A7X0JGV5_9SPHN|nr:STAS domain-containing protein [Sphingomonas endophytica]MBB6506482.1 anti-anti-sigma regulatory factor [Sphingomonas endophytica]